jgi:hypothetical protein
MGIIKVEKEKGGESNVRRRVLFGMGEHAAPGCLARMNYAEEHLAAWWKECGG